MVFELAIHSFDRILEIILRTVIIFLFTFIILRIRGKKQLGQFNVFDIVIIIALGSAVGDAMIYTEDIAPLFGSMIAISTVIILIWILENALEIAPSWVIRLIEGESTIIIRNGQFDMRALRKVNLRTEEIIAKLREQGVEKISSVGIARFESDGGISVIRKKRRRRVYQKIK